MASIVSFNPLVQHYKLMLEILKLFLQPSVDYIDGCQDLEGYGMNFRIEAVSMDDGIAIIDIFNYYVENSFAAYPKSKVPYEFFGLFLNMTCGYPFLAAKDRYGNVLGFGLLHPYNPMPAFSHVAEITYFIAPDHRSKGIGKCMLDSLLAGALEKGITSILASISSQNEPSLTFHKKNGFRECGRFLNIGRKFGQDFDIVWMQKMI
jgi:L-amino acid N-acyltransferase YncA